MSIAKISFGNKTTPVIKYRTRPPQNAESLENVELRVNLQMAADDANLNVTERLAINEEFFPSGKGLPLTPTERSIYDIPIAHIYNDDAFAQKALNLGIPNMKVRKTELNKGTFEANLESALCKLRKGYEPEEL